MTDQAHRQKPYNEKPQASAMRLTPHHAKYYAHDLTRRVASGLDRLSTALFDAAVDLNPHQIEAALFALQSPLSNGVAAVEAGDLVLRFTYAPDPAEGAERGCRDGHPRPQGRFTGRLDESPGYVNGDNNLENLKAPDDTWKVRLIEEDFFRLMFEAEGG
jgi:hypothetical protein